MGGSPDGSRTYVSHTHDAFKPSLRRRISNRLSGCLEKLGSFYEIIESRLDSKKLGHLPDEYSEMEQ